MEKTVNALEAERNFGKLLQEVATNGDRIIIERHGEPVAAVVPVTVLRQWQCSRKEAFDKLREISERASERAKLTEEEADELIEEAIRAVRSRQVVVEKMGEMAERANMSPKE